MKSKCASLRARIVHVPRMDNEGCHTSNRHDVTMVLLDHRREEFLNHEEVRDGIDLKSLADEVF